MSAVSVRMAMAIAMTLIGSGVRAQSADAAVNPIARFEWFSYQGMDPVFDQYHADTSEYVNPILAGFYPDPSITRGDDAYYIVTSSFMYFPGIPIFRSTDLVNWTQIGHVMHRPSQMATGNLGISRGIFAPAIRYHNGTYYVICTLVDAGGNFLVTASDPAGPWSDPIWLGDIDGIDPSIFFDDDGRTYILNNGPPDREPLYDGHRALYIREYFADTRTTGPAKLIVDGGVDLTKRPIWIEAPHLRKINGRYVLIAAEGGTGPQHSEVVFDAQSPWGPYRPYERNPILTQRHLDAARPFPVAYAGHADMVETPNGEWWAVFLGVRPYQGNLFNTGRETFLLPVRWTPDGWPVILEGDATVPYVHTRPNPPAVPAPRIPLTGNFTLRDEFDRDELDLYWTFIRTPQTRWYSLKRGGLEIKARAESIHGFAQPSFIGRRQQHTNATAAVAVTFDPQDTNDTAGLVAFQNDDFYYFLGITRDDTDARVVHLEKRANGQSEIVASAPLGGAVTSPVMLRIEAKGALYDFSYALAPDHWIALATDVDGTILSTSVAGGFVGTMLGMYASSQHGSAPEHLP